MYSKIHSFACITMSQTLPVFRLLLRGALLPALGLFLIDCSKEDPVESQLGIYNSDVHYTSYNGEAMDWYGAGSLRIDRLNEGISCVLFGMEDATCSVAKKGESFEGFMRRVKRQWQQSGKLLQAMNFP